MKFTIDDPQLSRLVLVMQKHQETYPGSSPYERNCGLEKALRDLRQFADDAVLRGEPECLLPTADQLREELGDLRAERPEVPEGNVMYLTIMESFSGLTPTTAIAVIARFYRLPFVVVEPNLPPSAMS